MEFLPLLAASTLVWKAVDFVKYLLARDKNATITQLTTWLGGVGVTGLLANSDFAENIEIGSALLGSMNWPSIILVGLSLGSSASSAFDLKKALDGSDSAKTPQMVQSSWPPPAPKP